MKADLRNILLKQRLALSQKETITKSKIIQENFFRLPESKKFSNFSVYLEINNEVVTKGLINFLVGQGKKVFLPKYSEKSKGYFLSKFSNWQKLEKGPYEILQPGNDDRISSMNIDVAVIPGVAFSPAGVRLGYGKGIFDKLFKDSKCLKIGLAYEMQITEFIPRDKHDLVMNLVITEEKVYRFKSI